MFLLLLSVISVTAVTEVNKCNVRKVPKHTEAYRTVTNRNEPQYTAISISEHNCNVAQNAQATEAMYGSKQGYFSICFLACSNNLLRSYEFSEQFIVFRFLTAQSCS